MILLLVFATDWSRVLAVIFHERAPLKLFFYAGWNEWYAPVGQVRQTAQCLLPLHGVLKEGVLQCEARRLIPCPRPSLRTVARQQLAYRSRRHQLARCADKH